MPSVAPSGKPHATESVDWASRSTSRTRRRAASSAPTLNAVVVLPTPPFWLTTAVVVTEPGTDPPYAVIRLRIASRRGKAHEKDPGRDKRNNRPTLQPWLQPSPSGARLSRDHGPPLINRPSVDIRLR